MLLPFPTSPLFRMAILIFIFITALFFEAQRPMRRATQPKSKRVLVNLGIAATAALLLRFSFYPLVIAVAVKVEDQQFGLLHWLKAPASITIALSVVLLDWTLYYWHWMLHKIPILWRFHNVHHVDLDLDTSTALRFHFGELAISAFYRSAQIFIFGISPFNLAVFELLITTFAQFHHSNIRLPIALERALSKITITPKMHGIHHSTIRSETDSNFGTIFSVWDYLHHSFKIDVPQSRIKIGVPAYQDPSELGIIGTLILPFKRQRPWKDSAG
jgi:sterol desaturase/sphingolipid hydroxylase (fatty acid hydroxylase superfamily)